MREWRALLDKGHENLAAAVLLAREGHFAIAVSRAYYAMFYAAEAVLEFEGVSRSKHSGVIAEFGRRFAKTGRLPRELHRFLIEAFEARNQADYDTGSVEPAAADEHISRAGQFLEAAEALLPGDA